MDCSLPTRCSLDVRDHSTFPIERGLSSTCPIHLKRPHTLPSTPPPWTHQVNKQRFQETLTDSNLHWSLAAFSILAHLPWDGRDDNLAKKCNQCRLAAYSLLEANMDLIKGRPEIRAALLRALSTREELGAAEPSPADGLVRLRLAQRWGEGRLPCTEDEVRWLIKLCLLATRAAPSMLVAAGPPAADEGASSGFSAIGRFVFHTVDSAIQRIVNRDGTLITLALDLWALLARAVARYHPDPRALLSTAPLIMTAVEFGFYTTVSLSAAALDRDE